MPWSSTEFPPCSVPRRYLHTHLGAGWNRRLGADWQLYTHISLSFTHTLSFSHLFNTHIHPSLSLSHTQGFLDFTDTGLVSIDTVASFAFWAKWNDFDSNYKKHSFNWLNAADSKYPTNFSHQFKSQLHCLLPGCTASYVSVVVCLVEPVVLSCFLCLTVFCFSSFFFKANYFQPCFQTSGYAFGKKLV